MSTLKIIPEIKILGDAVLRKKAKPVKGVTDSERRIFEDMVRIMHQAGGIGIAANQIGIDKQMIVIDIDQGILMLANPRVIKKQGMVVFEEGCLSLPEITLKIKRPKKITVECLDKDNCTIRFEADEILARALQHEIDHLHGRLIIDYAGWRQRLFFKRKIKKLRKQMQNG